MSEKSQPPEKDDNASEQAMVAINQAYQDEVGVIFRVLQTTALTTPDSNPTRDGIDRARKGLKTCVTTREAMRRLLIEANGDG
jgi:hypothetical protein